MVPSIRILLEPTSDSFHPLVLPNPRQNAYLLTRRAHERQPSFLEELCDYAFGSAPPDEEPFGG
jgi:hypothetical protein